MDYQFIYFNQKNGQPKLKKFDEKLLEKPKEKIDKLIDEVLIDSKNIEPCNTDFWWYADEDTEHFSFYELKMKVVSILETEFQMDRSETEEEIDNGKLVIKIFHNTSADGYCAVGGLTMSVVRQKMTEVNNPNYDKQINAYNNNLILYEKYKQESKVFEKLLKVWDTTQKELLGA